MEIEAVVIAGMAKALIAPISGLIGAFGGAYLTNLFAERRWARQLESDQDKERRVFLRAKGEEAYLALKKWEKELFFFHSSRIAFLQGSITKVEMDKNIDTKVDPVTHAKFQALIELYFPDLVEKLEEIHKQIELVNTIYLRWNGNVLTVAAAQKMIPESAVYERQMAHFSRKLRDKIKAI